MSSHLVPTGSEDRARAHDPALTSGLSRIGKIAKTKVIESGVVDLLLGPLMSRRRELERQRRELEKCKRELEYLVGTKMIRQAGFWFVDIPRTSSSSIRTELGRHFGIAYGKNNLIEREHATEQIFEDHVPASQMREIVGIEAWSKLYTFSVVRNPWDRTLSLYHYRKKMRQIPEAWRFPEYVKRLVDADESTPKFIDRVFRSSAADYVIDKEGVLLVDEIIRYEDRTAGLQRVARRIGLPNLGSVHLQAASPSGRCYRDMYDNTTRDLIGKYFARDVLLFGYEF